MVRRSSLSRRTRTALPLLGAGLLVAATAAISHAQAIPRITREVETSPLVSLPGEVHAWAQPQFDRGLAPADVSGHMLLAMRRSPAQESALKTLIASQQDPHSPNYRKWLTPEQFGKQFGVADADLQTVTGYLASRGLSVGHVYKNHMAIEVSATAEQMRSTFQTEIHRYSIGGKTFYANATAPKIPSALQGVVSGFASINNFKAAPSSAAGTQARFDAQTHTLAPLYSTNNGTIFGISPGDLSVIYDIPPATNPATGALQGGQNVNVGVLGDSNIDINYINNYRNTFNLGANPPIVVIDGNDPGMNDDAYIAYKQIELIGAVAPNATVYYYISATTDYDTGMDFALIRAVEDNQVQVLVNGYQVCEQNLGLSATLANAVAEQAAAQGITVVAAAGNTGPAACEIPGTAAPATTGFAVNGYASSPYTTAVGGTDFNYTSATTNYWGANSSSNSAAPFTSALQYIPEQAWNDSTRTGKTSVLLGGGGGASTVGLDGASLPQPIPGYQSSNAKAAAISNQVARSTQTTPARVLPDVSFFAGSGANNTIGYNNTAYLFCMQSTDCQGGPTPQFTYSGGTEASSAVFAGAMALVVANLNSTNPSAYGVGSANPALYSMLAPPAGQTPVVAPNDIKVGNTELACTNGTPNCTNGVMTGYAAGTGYDAATGLGSFDITNFVSNYTQPNTAGSTVTLTVLDPATGKAPVCGATPNCTNHSRPLEFIVSAASASGSGATPTGDVAVLTTSPFASQVAAEAIPLTGGTGTDNYYKTLPGGTYSLYARYGGDGTYAPSVTSASYLITVKPETCSMVVYANNTGGTITYGSPVTITAEPYSSVSTNGAVNPNNVAIPSGSLTVTDNGKTITTLPLNSEGSATYNSNLLAFGSHSLVLTYPGDASFTSCKTTPAYAVNIAAAPTTTTLSPANADASSGNLAMTAVVQSAAAVNNGTSPTGTVTFSTNPAKTVTLVPGFDVNGNAVATANTLVTSGQIVGAQVTATYNPATTEKNYTGSSTTVNVASTGSLFGNNPTTTAFTISDTYNSTNNTFPAQDSLTLNILVTSNAGGFSAPGCGVLGALCTTPYVSVLANGVLLANNLVPGGDGIVRFTLPQQNGYLALPSGQAEINVIYSGYKFLFGLTTQYNASSAYQTITINDDRTSADFSLQSDTTVNQAKPLVSPTVQATYNLRLTSIYNFQSAYNATKINLGCSVVGYTDPNGIQSTPSGMACGFDNTLSGLPVSVTYKSNSTSTGVITKTLFVGAAANYSIASNTAPAQPASRWWLATGSTTLACIFLLGLPKRRRNWQSMLGACVMAIVSFGMTGCGMTATPNTSQQTASTPGANGSAGANGAGGTAVPAGTYTVLVTASSTSNIPLVHTLPVQVIVGN